MLIARTVGRGLSLLAAIVAVLPAITACDCVPPPTAAVALQNSTGVFVGKVIAVEGGANNGLKTVTLNVERWWKGGDAVVVKVVTSGSGASCGYGFQKDGRYLVYARGNPQKNELWSVSLCSRTTDAASNQFKADLAVLGEGTAPKAK